MVFYTCWVSQYEYFKYMKWHMESFESIILFFILHVSIKWIMKLFIYITWWQEWMWRSSFCYCNTKETKYVINFRLTNADIDNRKFMKQLVSLWIWTSVIDRSFIKHVSTVRRKKLTLKAQMLNFRKSVVRLWS
jgi:hypothetical protein